MDKVCPICKINFKAKRIDSTYCSEKCSSRHWRINNKEKVKKHKREYKEKYSKTKKYKERQKASSARWYNKHQRGKTKTYKKICNNCLKEFIARRSDKIYCSNKCATKFWRKENEGHLRNYNKLKYNKEKRRERRKNNREGDLNYKHKRRAKEKETDITSTFLKQLKENTNTCIICNKLMNEISYNPLQKTLDHIITLHSGGTHTKNNVRFICRQCNLERPKDSRDILF